MKWFSSIALINKDIPQDDIQALEQQFHALRRLVASKAGFAGFTSLPNFREKIGVKVNKALKLGHDGISHAAIGESYEIFVRKRALM